MSVCQCDIKMKNTMVDNRITLIVGNDALIMNAIVQQIDNIFRVVWIANKILSESVMLKAARVNLITAIFKESLLAIKHSSSAFV